MIFSPNPNDGARGPSDRSYDRLHDGGEHYGDAPLPRYGRGSSDYRLNNYPSAHPDCIIGDRTLRLPIAGVEHHGEEVLTDLKHEFPKSTFEPAPHHREFRETLLETVHPSGSPGSCPHQLLRQEIAHRLLSQALSNLVCRAMNKDLHKLTASGDEETPVPRERELDEYLASAWAVRSFIRIAASEPEMFRILVTEMAQLHSQHGRFSLGVPMSPLLVYELFNAAARSPHIEPEVKEAFQIIGYKGAAAEKLYQEFKALLDKQLSAIG